jgi:hypothetical protein
LASRAAAPTRFNCVGAPFATASSNVPAIPGARLRLNTTVGTSDFAAKRKC